MKVEDLDISDKAKNVIRSDGIEELYPPQEKGVDDVLSGNNCVFAYPTASGKSLLAYLGIIKRVLDEGGKALYIVPLRALASEKLDDLKKFEELGMNVGISMGNYDNPDPSLRDYDVIIATSEKADSLLRHNVDWLSQLNCVIADEVHLVNDRERGATLEVTLSKMKQANPAAQIIALSATIRNSDMIANWLDAKHHKSDWRPVELKKGVFNKNKIKYADGEEKKLEPKSGAVSTLADPTLEGGDQCLVFVRSRKSTRSVSKEMTSTVEEHLSEDEEEGLKEVADEIESRSNTSVGKNLAEMIRSGTAFHNAGLNNFQRKKIEEAFRDRLIKFITATPTLAAGINMPARKVIVRDCKRYDALLGYNAPIPVMEIQQMLGRAGRPGYDDLGEAILVAKKRRQVNELYDEYLLGQSEAIVSRMATEPALRTHLLSLIATEHCAFEEEIYNFMEQTFYSQQSEIWSIEERVRKTLEMLKEEELVREDDCLEATRFGKRVSDLYIDPLSAVKIRNAVKSGKMGLDISYLHTICLTPNMYNLFASKTELQKYKKKAESLRADLFEDFPHDRGELEEYLRAFKTALLLQDWIEEVPEDEIADKFGIGPGDIYNKVETADWLLHASAEIAKMFNKQKEAKLTELTERVKHGVKENLFELVELDRVGRVRARSLYRAGYETIEEVREASPEELRELPGIGTKLAERLSEKEFSEENKIKEKKKESSSGQASLVDF
ncbi:MAG: DEAD/DEAH box helicase [Candidatus Thermoplasmatota archaeon]|nr:DEAD/DEAH box helicase [Candidatus Thermoplasmatota archaeon]MBS3790785.1 DEAD/DEAH box helicase [Candidatus Thermoplasmatota archaeon]